MLTNDQWDDIIQLAMHKQQQALADGSRTLWVDPANGRKYLTHPPSRCAGQPCVFHNPSHHVMSDRPINIRETGLIERLCIHGVGHPDPDSVAFLSRNGDTYWSVHGCDLCCSSRSVDKSPSSNG